MLRILSFFLLFGLASGLLGGQAETDDKKARSAWNSFRGNAQLTGVAVGDFTKHPTLRWTFDTKDEIESTAAIYGETVYLGAINGKFYALDLATGQVRWEYDAKSGIRSSPAVANGLVYFGDEVGVFHALDQATGDKKWTFQTHSEIISAANFYKDRVIFGSYDQYLYCLNARDGSLLWKLETEQYIHATPAIYEGQVLISGCDGFFRMIDIESGTQKHSIYMGSQAAASSAVLKDRAYIGTFGNQVLCINLKTPEVQWYYEHPRRHFPFYASPAVTSDFVLVAGRDKMVHALDPETGDPRWVFSAKARIDASPVVAGDRVYIAAINGQIYGLAIATGAVEWEFDIGADLVASPSIASGHLVIGSVDGVVYSFGEKKE